METHSSVFAWRIPGTGEPGGLPSMGSHRVGHDWSDLAAAVYKNLFGPFIWSQLELISDYQSNFIWIKVADEWIPHRLPS